MFKDKNILVTGGSGMIGRQLVSLLLNEGANIHVADLNKPINMSQNIIFHNIDLKDFNIGIYLLKISSGQHTESKLFIKK